MRPSAKAVAALVLASVVAGIFYVKMEPNLAPVEGVSAAAYPLPIPTPRAPRPFPPTLAAPSPRAPMPTRTPFPEGTPIAPSDLAAIKATIERAYELQGLAARNFDISAVHTVYVNDPRVRLSDEQLDLVTRALAHLGGRVPQVGDTPGMLDYVRLHFAYWQLGDERLEQRLRGFQINPQDGPIGPPRRSDPVYKAKIRYDDVKVEGDRAEVVLDDGAALQSLLLVKTRDGWRIAGLRPLWIHF